MAKTDFLTADMTRRQFMKISGKSLAGLSLSASMLSLFGCSQQQVDAGAVATWALPQGLLVVNADLCTGCQRCEINCTLTNDASALPTSAASRSSAASIWMAPATACSPARTTAGSTSRTPAASVRTCLRQRLPAEGHHHQRSGIRVVDTDKCIGCGACHEACPWHMPTVNPETGKSSKCIACGACVAGCPSGALSIVDWTPSPAQHRLPTWTCKEEKQWLNLMAGQASSCVSI
mgnify:CR=1 FL=1